MIKVYTAGVFDLLHYGHVRYLEKAKSLGDMLIVGLLTDEGTERYKGKNPILTYEQRLEVISALKCVDLIVRQDDTDPTETLKKLKDLGWVFDYMVRADDYEGIPQGTEFIEANGGKVVRLPYCKEINSTFIKERLINE
jgi:rfaE bifunctional protein nucleotidyltransferase chain/domain